MVAPKGPGHTVRSEFERGGGVPCILSIYQDASGKAKDIGLAINSAYGRTQNQLHIHVDCLAAEVHQTLALDSSAIGPNWSALPHGLKGHPYWARRLISEDLVDANPFLLLADAVPDARAHMGQYTLVVVGARFEDGQNGFILLTDRADLATADRASGEEVQDHDCRP